MIASLDELYAIEEEKRTLEPDSRRFIELAARVESLARTVLDQTRRQDELARETHRAAARGHRVSTPIDEVPPRPIHAVLADWRAAERRLERADPGTSHHDAATADIRRLRDEYQRALEAAETADGTDGTVGT